MSLEIRLLPDDPEHLEESRKTILARTSDFVVRILNHAALVPPERYYGIDQRQASLASDLLTARFWGALTWIDGRTFSDRNDQSPEERTNKNKEAQAWSAKTFQPYELNILLNLIVNQALLKPVQTSWPGTDRGHSILYRELVERDDSIYAGAVKDSFRRRLINGRFWEELAADLTIVQDTLENHYEELDPAFAVSHGFGLLKLNQHSSELIAHKFRSINEKALKLYAQFLERLDAQEGCTPVHIETLLRPYLARTLEWNWESNEPYFNGGTDFEGQVHGEFQEKLQMPVVQKYVAQSSNARIYLAVLLGKVIAEHENSITSSSSFVKEVLGQLPNPKQVMELLLPQLQTEKGLKFFQESERCGHNMYQFMP